MKNNEDFLKIHFEEEPCSACLPNVPSVLPQHHTTKHESDTAVHKTKEPNTTRTITTRRREGHRVGLQHEGFFCEFKHIKYQN